MHMTEFHGTGKLVVSFELYPPKTPEAEAKLFDRAIPALLDLSPAFWTCTYGAGGSTREKTLEVAARVKNQVGAESATHLTCLGRSRRELAAYLERAREQNVTNVVALRGDPPQGTESFEPHPDGFSYAVELVEFIRELGGFDIAVAGYPEGHPECPDKHLDWQRCRDKVEAGAGTVISQLFFDSNDFFEFEDYLKNKLGVTAPIVPGILPIMSTAQIKRFCGLCGAKLPPQILDRLESYADDNASARQYGVELATDMCEELIQHGVPGLHFYTLNRAASVAQIMTNLSLPV